MTLDRIHGTATAALILVVALFLSGCTSVPEPGEASPPERPGPQAEPKTEPEPRPQPAPGQAEGKVELKPAPVVNLLIPETSLPATLEEYPVQLDLRAMQDGRDEGAAVEVLFQQDLLERGITLATPGKMGHALAQVLVRLDLKAWKVRDLGAGRAQVEGDGNVAVVRKQGNVTIGRAPLTAMSDANSTERKATKQVLDTMCTAAAELVREKVTEYAARTHRKILTVNTESEGFNIDTFCDALEQAIDREAGLVLVDPTVNRAAKSATFNLWIAPEYEGDLTEFLARTLGQSGTGNKFEVEVKVTR